MGNAITCATCFRPEQHHSAAKLISYGGATTLLAGKHLAGEIMFESPDHVVCHADSFFIGRPIPSLAIEDELIGGQTYFLLPLDRLARTHNVLSASSLAALGPGPNKNRAGPFKGCGPFEYTKGPDGRVSIRVTPEFITRLISTNEEIVLDDDHDEWCGNNSPLCSTPELQKHYKQLVGPKDQMWSPKLETINECKIRCSPCRFLGLEWKQQERKKVGF